MCADEVVDEANEVMGVKGLDSKKFEGGGCAPLVAINARASTRNHNRTFWI